MKPMPGIASLASRLNSTVFLLVAITSAQSPPAAMLSPVVKEYVKFDDDVIALTHVRVIDGTGTPARADQTVILRNGRIEAMGDAVFAAVPRNAKVLDLSGYSVMPGLVGMH